MEKIQKSTLGETTGSLMNYLMGNNKSIPEVGKGATILQWSDRHAYEVLSVENDGTRVKLQRYNSKRIDSNGMSDVQEYEYKELLQNSEIVIVWKFDSWRQEVRSVEFTSAFLKTISEMGNFHESPDYKEIFPDDSIFPALIKGKTRIVVKYPKINVIWGLKQEYNDYSF